VIEGNPGESLSGGTYAAPVIGNVLSQLLKGYKPPSPEEQKKAEEAEAEETAAELVEETTTDPVLDSDESMTLSLDTPVELSEFTSDLMNPEGAPTLEETPTE